MRRTPENVYTSTLWRELLARIIAKRGRRCEWPGCGRTGCRIFGDHIVELKDGGAPLDEYNVMLLCGSCQIIKTHIAKRAREARP